MGCYVNPPEGKQDWIARHAEPLPGAPTWDAIPVGKVALSAVLNPGFVAIGVAFSPAELAIFSIPDHRPQRWYLADRDAVALVAPLDEYEAIARRNGDL